MMRCNGTAEKGNRAITLVQNSTKTGTGSITVNDETLGEVWQLEKWSMHQGLLEIRKGPFGVIRPAE